MRYYVTIDDREFSFAVQRGRGTTQVAVVPERSRESALAAEVLSHDGRRSALVVVDGRVFRIRTGGSAGASPLRRGAWLGSVNGREVRATLESDLERRAAPQKAGVHSPGARLTAPMPGRIVSVSVRAGDQVEAGAALLSIEAMKMENELQAPCAGRVVRVAVQAGSTVEADQELLAIDPI